MSDKLNADVLVDGTDEEVVKEIWRWSRTADTVDANNTEKLWFIVGVLLGRMMRRAKQ